jgi:predicted dehydrogenase
VLKLTASKRLRVAQIGCGQIAPQHVRAYADSGLVDVAVVMDIHEQAARELAAACGDVPWTTSFEDAIARPGVDFVSIATPHHLHTPQVIAAARAGKHVLCEKPITTSLADADAMLAACREHGVTLGMWMVMRYTGPAYATRALLQAGAIGEIVNVRLPNVFNKTRDYYQRGVGSKGRPTDWRGAPGSAGGGALMMNTTHELDMLRAATGLEVQRVSAEWARFTGLGEVEDMIDAVLRYRNGAIGTITSGNYAPGGGEPHVIRLYGTKGQLQLERGKPLRAFLEEPFAGTEGIPPLTASEWHDVPFEQGPSPRTTSVADFARAILDGRAPQATGEDGRAILQIVLAAYQSAREGRTVELL